MLDDIIKKLMDSENGCILIQWSDVTRNVPCG